jgi:hypothetical protein
MNPWHINRRLGLILMVCLATLLLCTQGLGSHLHLHDHQHVVAASAHHHPNPIHPSHFGEVGGHVHQVSEIDISPDGALNTSLLMVTFIVALASAMGMVLAAVSINIPLRDTRLALTSRLGAIPLRRGPPFLFRTSATH